jgi:hypothetical protein
VGRLGGGHNSFIASKQHCSLKALLLRYCHGLYQPQLVHMTHLNRPAQTLRVLSPSILVKENEQVEVMRELLHITHKGETCCFNQLRILTIMQPAVLTLLIRYKMFKPITISNCFACSAQLTIKRLPGFDLRCISPVMCQHTACSALLCRVSG